MTMLEKGIMLVKIRDKDMIGLKTYRRFYKLNTNDLKIDYFPNKALSAGLKNCSAGGPGGKLQKKYSTFRNDET